MKYTHIGYSYSGVPAGWIPIVEKAIKDIEKVMWPRWLPMSVKRWIHWLATDNSVVRLKYRWAYKIRNLLTGGQMITDIKDKYATLRIYGYYGDKIEKIIKQAEVDCGNTCERCGKQDGTVKIRDDNWWMRNLCNRCQEREEKKKNNS